MNKFQFDNEFQDGIIAFIINDNKGIKVLQLIKPEYFTLIDQMIIAKGLKKYHKKYGNIPAKVTFKEFLKEHGKEEKSEFYIPTVADHLIKTGKAKFKVLPCAEKWFGVTYPEDRPTAVESFKSLAEKGVYPLNLWA